MELITDIDDPRIAFFRTLKGHPIRLSERNIILVEGPEQVSRLLTTALELDTLFMEPRYYETLGAQLSTRDLSKVTQYSASRELMGQIVGYGMHHGILALARRPQFVKLQELVPPIVALNGLSDPENVGGIVRTCRAFGVQSLLVDGHSCDPYLRRAVRVSMGAIFDMKVCLTEQLEADLHNLGKHFAVVAIEQNPGSQPLPSQDLPRDIVLVFGQERHGISQSVLKECSVILEIPMDSSMVNSLNVHAATAIVLERLWRNEKGPVSPPGLKDPSPLGPKSTVVDL